MGGVELEEPVTKRVKASVGELRDHSNVFSIVEPAIDASGDYMARPLISEVDEEFIGPNKVIKRVQFVRIIANALHSLGYKKSCAHLEEESGIPLRSAVISRFMQQIHDGEWNESMVTLHEISLPDQSIVKKASSLILEQKFSELVEGEDIKQALKILRTEITPLGINRERIRELSSFIISPSVNNFSVSSSQPSLRKQSRAKLLEDIQKLFSPMIMVPEKRLEHLVERAILLQKEACIYHNSSSKEISLYMDHHCGRKKIPCQTLQILQAHDDEIWFLQFSHNGKYLASASNDRTAIIWEVDLNCEVFLKHKLLGHRRPVSSLSWSPDDGYLLTCGMEETLRLWKASTGECLRVYEKPGLGLVSCGWFPNGKWIVSGVNDESICIWELEGKELECWKGQRTTRISDLEITNDGKEIISICSPTSILLLDRKGAERFISEDEIITSFQLSSDSKFVLVNLLNEQIHLWSIEGDIKRISIYMGHKRSRFVIRSCFGGIDQAFVASGSEDSLVYIWKRKSWELLEALAGHSGCVNCVSWNPSNPHMLASGSDDRTIRIWGPKKLTANATHHCNGCGAQV